MRTHARIIGLVLVSAALLVGCGNKDQAPPPATGGGGSTAAEAKQITFYVPCGMLVPFSDTIKKFEETHPGVTVKGEYDNAVVLAEKVLQKGERPDVFCSPGFSEMQMLKDKGLIDESTQVGLAKFELVVLVHRDSKLELKSPEDLKKCKTISMPEPGPNSVGTAAKEALDNLGLWDDLEPKIVKTKHAIESHQFVGTNRSDAGFAYDNCPLETAPEKLSKMIVQPAFFFDKKLYKQQECLVAVLNDSPNPELAKEFVEFLDSNDARAILEKDGLKGCLKEGAAPVQKVIVHVTAFYPGNEGHKPVKEFIEGLNDEYEGKVRAEFVDFTSDEGMHRWQKAGLNCGTVLINGDSVHTYEQPDGTLKEVHFQMGINGYWNKDDVHAVIDKLLTETAPPKTEQP